MREMTTTLPFGCCTVLPADHYSGINAKVRLRAVKCIISLTILMSLCACVSQSNSYQLGNLVIQGVPPIPARIIENLERYQSTRSASFQGWLGESILISTRFGEVTELHRVQQPLAMREQLTFFSEPVSTAIVQPQSRGNKFIYFRDVGGSEFYQYFYYDMQTRTSTLLTDGSSKYGSAIWSRQGDRIAYTSMQRNGKDKDIYLRRIAPDEAQEEARAVLVSNNTAWWDPADFSRDGNRLLVIEHFSNREAYLHELDLLSGERTPLLDHAVKMYLGRAAYSRDGRTVYFTANLGSEFMRLHSLNLDTGALKVLSEEYAWDVESFALSEDGRWLSFSINEAGVSRLNVISLPDEKFVALPQVPVGVISGLEFRHDGNQLGFTLTNPTSPADVYSINLISRNLVRWTLSEMGGLDSRKMVTPRIISYPTFDTETNGVPRRIPALVYSPSLPSGSGESPVVIRIHGGPESQYRPWFSYINQYLVNELGVTVITPNVRGSRGYGKSYMNLDNGYLREDSVKDIGALLDWIEQQPEMDSDRVVVMGGSYGGYMVLASLVHYSDRLRAGYNSIGISNFVSFLENTRAYRRDLRRAEYGDERVPEMRKFLESISPLNHVASINKPMLITQGLNDPRVPAGESAQIVKALGEEGIQAWYILAKDEGHGFKKKSNRDFSNAALMLFLEKHLFETIDD